MPREENGVGGCARALLARREDRAERSGIDPDRSIPYTDLEAQHTSPQNVGTGPVGDVKRPAVRRTADLAPIQGTCGQWILPMRTLIRKGEEALLHVIDCNLSTLDHHGAPLADRQLGRLKDRLKAIYHAGTLAWSGRCRGQRTRGRC